MNLRVAAARSARSVIAAALAVGLAASGAGARERERVELERHGATEARGRVTFSLRDASEGRLDVRASRLESEGEYELIVGGVKVATVQSNRRGRVQARFSSRPRGHDLFLGFDPRGAAISIRKVGDDDALSGSLPEDESNDTDVTCCLPDHGGDGDAECEDRTPEECAAQGGTVVAADTCLPDPCGGTPPEGTDIVCCIPDDSGAECEDRTPAECLAAGGTVVEATSCAANPCAATPPEPDDDVRCCVPGSGYYATAECEDRTADECAALGGVDLGPGSCTPNPCADVVPPGGGTPSVRVTCERRSDRSRVSVDGSGLAAGAHTARITSGTNTATSAPRLPIGDEAEFDFDSDGGDIGEGATPIAAGFILGSPAQVTGEIIDSLGTVVATATVTCSER